jgi:O-antigen/teichoic acid export membrane protein
MAEVLASTAELDPADSGDVLELDRQSRPPSEFPPPAEIEALESRALNATFWTIVQYGAGQGLRIVNSYILTRLLLPEAVGEMTLVTTLIVGITMLSDIGLAPSVIQSPRGDEAAFLNTAWTLQALRGIGMWVVALLLCWPASHLYNWAGLKVVLAVLAFNTVITGLNGTSLLTISRHMGVRMQFIVEFTTQIVALVVTVTCAWYWRNVWALVVGSIISSLYRLAFSHSPFIPGIRNRFHWDRAAVKDILHFGKWIFLGTAFFFFASQADKLYLGRLVPLAILGIYGIAYQISDVPRSVINAFSYRVGYPFISKIIHLPMEDFRRQYLGYRRYVLLVGALLLSLMVVFGDVLVRLLYKPLYANDASWMVPILAIGLWHTLMYMTTSPVLLALGKSKYNAVGNGVFCFTMLAAIPIGFHFWGIRGAVWAVAGGDLPLYCVFQYGAVREGVRPLRQDLQLTVMFIALLGLEFAARHTIH